MSIIYILTTGLMMILHILLHKKEEKQNILKWIVISACLLLCYNTVISVILTFIKIKTTLISLSIMNFITSFVLGLKIYKDKKIQKYFINKIDIISLIIIFFIVIGVAIKQYGIPLNVKNSITDASTHYFAAFDFYKHSILLLEENSDKLYLYNASFLMPGAYVNTGILFKIFSPLISETYFPKLFIIFEIMMWFLSGLLMYILLVNNKKEEKQKILPLILSLIYMLGYPLNTLISGFSYLQVGTNIIICIIIIMQQQLKQQYKTVLMFLADFGLMFSYYYFAPVVFLSIFIQIIIDIKKRKEKIFSANNIVNITNSLILPGIFGIMYFIVLRFLKLGIEADFAHAINIPGTIYSNFITNIIIFILLSIFYIIHNIKNKKENILNKLLIITMIFLVIVYIGMKLQKVSEYYYYKVYYMLWIYLIVATFYALKLLKNKNKIITYLGVFTYCIGTITSIALNKDLLFFDIYQKNFQEVQLDYKLIKHEELEILDYFNQNIDINNMSDNTYILMSNSWARGRWMYAITENAYLYIDTLECGYSDIEPFISSDKKYCMLFKQDNENIFNSIDEVIEKNNLKVLCRNEEGIILEKK